MSSDPWGRVDETGTVYVRTADGEKVVGSWQAGSPEEALAYFERKYEGLVVEIGLLEKRVKTTDLSAKDAQTAVDHLREQVDAHHAVGDLEALRARLDQLVALVETRREERKAQRAKQSDEARGAKEALVAEAEELARSDQWRAAGERLRSLVDTWKGLPRLDRKSDDELWHRFSHARSAFSKRRKQHFAQLDAQREEARRIKERLVSEAEALSNSTDWGPTAARYRDLMSEWKAAGRAQREHEDDLWNRFRGARTCSSPPAARSSPSGTPSSRRTSSSRKSWSRRPRSSSRSPTSSRRAPRSVRSTSAGRPSATCRATPGRRSRGGCTRSSGPSRRPRRPSGAGPTPRHARVRGLTGQLQAAVDKLRSQVEQARAQGNDAKADKLARELEGRQALLDQALKGLHEFGG